MKVLTVSFTFFCCIISVVLTAETTTKKLAENSDKEKRGTATAVTSYATAKPATLTNADVAYATAKVVPSVPKVQYGQHAQLQYISQPQQLLRYTQIPQHQAQQHQFYYEQQQPVGTAVKYSAAPAKISYATTQPNHPNHIQYSLASDVSSFSYSSPLVEYNNLGLLTQHKVPVQTAPLSTHHQQQQESAYHQAIPVATNTKQQHVAYQPAAAKVATAYVVAAQPHYHAGAAQQPHYQQIQQVAYAAAPATGQQQQQQHAQYAYAQLPQQYTNRAHQAEYSAEPQYIAIPAQQFYYAQQQTAAPQQSVAAHAQQQYAQPQLHYQQLQEHAQYSPRDYTVSSAGGQHSAPHAVYSIAPEYYRENAQGFQYQQGKYSGQNVGIQYA